MDHSHNLTTPFTMVSSNQTTSWDLFTFYDSLAFETGVGSRALIAAIAGIAVHHLLLRRGEWHLKAPTIIETWLLSFPVLYSLEAMCGSRSTFGNAINALYLMSIFALSIFISIIVYWVFFHRLRGFPGPRLAAISKLWHSAHCVGAIHSLLPVGHQ